MLDILGDLEDDALADVISAAYEGESAYSGPDGDDVDHHRTDWQRFLDLVEVRAGLTDADDVYSAWVVDPDQQALLDARAPARESYVAIDEADGDWLPPLGLRTAMTDWTFDDATTISAALGADGATLTPDSLASTASAVQAAVEQTGLPEPATVRQSYEEADSADDYAALESLLPQAVEVVGNVGEATASAAEDANPFGELGQLLLSVDASAADSRESLAAGDLDAADAAAATTIDRAGVAPWLGGGVVVVMLAVLAGAALLIIRARRRPAPAVTAGPWPAAPVGFEANTGTWPAPGAATGPGTGQGLPPGVPGAGGGQYWGAPALGVGPQQRAPGPSQGPQQGAPGPGQQPAAPGPGVPGTWGAGPATQQLPVTVPFPSNGAAAALPPHPANRPGGTAQPLTTPHGVVAPSAGHALPPAFTGGADTSTTGHEPPRAPSPPMVA